MKSQVTNLRVMVGAAAAPKNLLPQKRADVHFLDTLDGNRPHPVTEDDSNEGRTPIFDTTERHDFAHTSSSIIASRAPAPPDAIHPCDKIFSEGDSSAHMLTSVPGVPYRSNTANGIYIAKEWKGNFF